MTSEERGAEFGLKRTLMRLVLSQRYAPMICQKSFFRWPTLNIRLGKVTNTNLL